MNTLPNDHELNEMADEFKKEGYTVLSVTEAGVILKGEGRSPNFVGAYMDEKGRCWTWHDGQYLRGGC